MRKSGSSQRGRMGGNEHKLLQGKFLLYIRKKLFSKIVGQGPEKRSDFCPWGLSKLGWTSLALTQC